MALNKFQLRTQTILLAVACFSYGFELPDLKGASDSLIDIVLSDEYDALFQRGKTKTNGMTLLRHIEANTKLKGDNFEELFYKMLGQQSLEDLKENEFTWNEATDVINAIIKLSDNVSVNESRKPNSKYQHEDDRITKAKKVVKKRRKAEKPSDKDEL